MPGLEEMKARVVEGLKKVFDPEIAVNIYDLGFIYDIGVTEDGKVHILMTLTMPGCPMHGILTRDVKEQIGKIEGVTEVNVELTFNPRWSAEKITEDGKNTLRGMGYNV